jgi:hypothetical protein
MIAKLGVAGIMATLAGFLAPCVLAQVAPADLARARTTLAAMLGTSPADRSLSVEPYALAAQPGVRFILGRSPGVHSATEEALVAIMPDSSLLPLGCTASRRVLQSVFPPRFDLSGIVAYARDLAVLDGQVGPTARVINELADAPEWVRTFAREQHVQVPATQVIAEPGGGHTVVLLIWGGALWQVEVHIGTARGEDVVFPSHLLVGNPPG